jgi:hypothetical protein
MNWRPALPNRSLTLGRAIRLRIRTADTSFLVRVRCRTSWVRRDVSRRSARVESSAIQTWGSRSAASSSASVRASTRSFLTFAWLIARTCIGLASTTSATRPRRMLAIANALPVDSRTTRSSGARLEANSSSASRVVSIRPADRARPRSRIATSQKSRCTSKPRYRMHLPSSLAGSGDQRGRTTTTHSCSQHTRGGRRGGQLCQRARSPRSETRPARSAFSHRKPRRPGPATLRTDPDATGFSALDSHPGMSRN